MEYEKLNHAIVYATHKHRGQFRKHSGLPYIVHPLAVMNTLIDCGFYEHEDLLAAAVLHDVVEDCGVTVNEIYKLFGYRVSCFVGDVTKSNATYVGETRKDSWNFYLDYLKSKCALSKALKIADRYCNIVDYKKSYGKLNYNQKEFVDRVYLYEALSLLSVVDNEELSIPLKILCDKLRHEIINF